jgi:hypothetical protein
VAALIPMIGECHAEAEAARGAGGAGPGGAPDASGRRRWMKGADALLKSGSYLRADHAHPMFGRSFHDLQRLLGYNLPY